MRLCVTWRLFCRQALLCSAPGLHACNQHYLASSRQAEQVTCRIVSSVSDQFGVAQVTHRDTLSLITELTGAAVTTRGYFAGPGRPLPEGEKKLYLLIEGPTESSVRKAKVEVKRILEETTEKAMRRDQPSGGRYSVM